MKDINKDDLRWTKGDYKTKNPESMTYIETLMAMCETYGTFCGRWHSNDFWLKTKNEIDNMNEDQAKERVFQIENDADGSLDKWKQYQ